MKIIKKRVSLDSNKKSESEQHQFKEFQFKEYFQADNQADNQDSTQEPNAIIFSTEVSIVTSLLRWLAVCSFLILSTLWVSA